MSRVWRRLLDCFAPLRPVGGFRVTLDGEPWLGEFSRREQLNGPSYTIPRIEGDLCIWQRYERRLWRVRLGARDDLIARWIDGLNAYSRGLDRLYRRPR